MTQFRHKPQFVEAARLSELQLETMFKFLGESKNYPECDIAGIDPSDGKFKLKVKTLEGEQPFEIIEIGDWIVKEGSHFYRLTDAQFRDRFEIEEGTPTTSFGTFPPGFRINFAVNNDLDNTTCLMFMNQQNFDIYKSSIGKEKKG